MPCHFCTSCTRAGSPLGGTLGRGPQHRGCNETTGLSLMCRSCPGSYIRKLLHWSVVSEGLVPIMPALKPSGLRPAGGPLLGLLGALLDLHRKPWRWLLACRVWCSADQGQHGHALSGGDLQRRQQQQWSWVEVTRSSSGMLRGLTRYFTTTHSLQFMACLLAALPAHPHQQFPLPLPCCLHPPAVPPGPVAPGG